MAQIIVTITADSGAGSLRQALSDAASGDTIVFDSSLEEGGVITIFLESRLIQGNSVTIDGGDTWNENGTLKTRVILDAQNLDRVFNGASNKNLIINGVTFQNGTKGEGSLFLTYSSTTFNNCVFKNGTNTTRGGIYCNSGNFTININNCLFDNLTGPSAAAVYGYTSLNINFLNCKFSNTNTTTNGDADCNFNVSCVVSFENCTFTPSETNANIVNNTTTGNCGFNNCTIYKLRIAENSTTVINGKLTAVVLTINNGSTVTFSGVDSILAVTTTASIGSATFTAADGATGYAAFPAGTDISASTFTGVKTATYSTSTPTVSASIGDTRTATVDIANADPGYIAEIVYADGVVGDITIDDGSAVIAVDKAFKIRVFNGAFYESATVARTYYLKTFDADGDFATAADWTLDAQKTLTCNAAPTISGGVFYCTEPAEG